MSNFFNSPLLDLIQSKSKTPEQQVQSATSPIQSFVNFISSDKGKATQTVDGRYDYHPDTKSWSFMRSEKPLEFVEQKVAEILPGTGDIAEIAQIGKDISSGQLGSALLGASLLVIPGNASTLYKKYPFAMTHVADSKYLLKTAQEGKEKLIAPSFAIVKGNQKGKIFGETLNEPVIFFGTKKIVTDPKYEQYIGDAMTPGLNGYLFKKSKYTVNDNLSEILKDEYDNMKFKSNPVSFEESVQNIHDPERKIFWNNYNEGKLWRDYDYNESPIVLGPDKSSMIKLMNKHKVDYVPYSPTHFKEHFGVEYFDDLIDAIYKQVPEVKFKQGGKIDEND